MSDCRERAEYTDCEKCGEYRVNCKCDQSPKVVVLEPDLAKRLVDMFMLDEYNAERYPDGWYRSRELGNTQVWSYSHATSLCIDYLSGQGSSSHDH